MNKVRQLTGSCGAEAVFDFADAPPATELAWQMVAINSFSHIVGIGDETLQAGIFSTPLGASVNAPYWGTRSGLMEVLDLERSEALTVHVKQFAIEDAVEACHKLHEGTVSGRAVIAF